MAPSTSNDARAPAPLTKKRKQAVPAQSSPPPRKKLRADSSLEESSEKGATPALEDLERPRQRVDKGKAKAVVDGNESTGPSKTVAQSSSASRAEPPRERQARSSTSKKDAPEESTRSKTGQPSSLLKKPNRRKLAPQRPWPSVPTSSNATGPHSAWAEGKNKILVGRKTPLGAYLRRSKDCILVDGYKTLYLSATSAAIPTLLTIATSLPEMLPYAKEEIHIEYKTGTVRCMDEILPDEDEEEDEDPTIQSELVERKIASLSVVITIGDGKKEITGKERKAPKKLRGGGFQNAQRTGQGRRPKPTSQPDMSSDDEMFE